MDTKNTNTRKNRVLSFFRKPFARPVQAVFYLLCPIAAFYLLEFMTHNPFADIHLTLHLFNWLLYFLFYTCCFFLIGHMSAAFGLASFLVLAVGLINYFTLQFRGSPILPWDVNSIGTAVSVVGNQSFQLTPPVVGVSAAFGLLILLSLHCDLRVRISGRRLGGAAASVLLTAVLAGGLQTDAMAQTLDLYEMPFTQGYTYRQNGFLVSYLMNTKYLSIDRPVSYDVSALEETVAAADELFTGSVQGAFGSHTPGKDSQVNAAVSSESREPSEDGDTKQPNVIVIMNEAFSDLSVLGDLQTNKDYMPFYRSLTENTVSGTAFVSVLGGNTANSEFEFLTGDTMAFLPVGSIPYQQYVQKEIPSLVNVLKEQGYHTVAMHPYYASGWNRDQVYDYLGFDEKYFLDDFQGAERFRQYVSDWGMYQKIISLYQQKEEGQPLFLFGVTMQNHSGYSKEYDNFSNDVHVLDQEYQNADTYLSLIAQSDRAYERLIRYFSQVEEPTVIVMFGDHQPTSLENRFFAGLLGKDPQLLSLEETALRYQTPFKIWANYEIAEESDVEISVNFLSTLLMRLSGLELSDYQDYLWNLHETLPVITANFFIDAEGKLYGYDEETMYQEELDSYSSLQYNHLFDDRNRLMEIFILPTKDE